MFSVRQVFNPCIGLITPVDGLLISLTTIQTELISLHPNGWAIKSVSYCCHFRIREGKKLFFILSRIWLLPWCGSPLRPTQSEWEKRIFSAATIFLKVFKTKVTFSRRIVWLLNLIPGSLLFQVRFVSLLYRRSLSTLSTASLIYWNPLNFCSRFSFYKKKSCW